MGHTFVTKTRRGFLLSLGGLVAGLTATSMTAQTFQTAQAKKIHVEDDVTKLWSKPVNGVRARLVATRDEFTLEHPTSLIMLFQNVGDKPVQLPGGVNVMPTLPLKGEQPYGNDHDFNAAIWMSRRKKRLEPSWNLQPLIRQLTATPSIKPGGIHIAIITIATVRVHRQAPLRHEPIGENRDVQRRRVRLSVTEPGEYVLEAAWSPEGLATSPDHRRPQVAEPWQGKQIDFPPIKVRILKVERQNDNDER